MRVAPTEQQVVDRRWREYYEARIEDGRRKHESRIKGLPVLRQLDNGREFEFRSRLYHAPPVPYETALDVLQVQLRWDALVRAAQKYEEAPESSPPPDVHEWRAVCREVARLFKLVFKPNGWRRLFWFLTPSPLLNAPPAEVGRAIGFFSALQRRDAIESLLQEAVRFPTGTSPEASTASSSTTPRSANGASPGRRSVRNPGKRSSWGSR